MFKVSKFKAKHNGKCNCKTNCKDRTRDSKRKARSDSSKEKTSPELRLNISPTNTCTLLPNPNKIINQGKRIEPLNAHIEGTNETPYLKYAELAKRLGAWDAVTAKCASCNCGACCPCLTHDYALTDAVFGKIHKEMRAFDSSVKENCKVMRIMYDIL